MLISHLNCFGRLDTTIILWHTNPSYSVEIALPPSITLSVPGVSTKRDAGGRRGEMPEWPKGTDCKSVAERFRGSNPLLPTIIPAHIAQRQSTSLVKKRSWVRFPVWAGSESKAIPLDNTASNAVIGLRSGGRLQAARSPESKVDCCAAMLYRRSHWRF